MDMENSSEADTGTEISNYVILQTIYTSCDVEKKNSVPVGDLINYVRPFLQHNTSELRDLEVALDPNNTNLCVTSEEFYKCMSEWVKKLKKEAVDFVDENSFTEPHPSDSYLVNEKEFPLVQSTPRAKHVLKDHETVANLNISNVSGYSITDCNVPSMLDSVFLEEKIKELEHQLNKANSENDLLKQQFAAIEEHNDTLQCELNKVRKKLLSGQQMLETLQKDKKETDELKEELLAANKEIEYLRSNFNASEKKVHNLNTWIRQLQEEKSTYSKKSEKSVESTQNLEREMYNLQEELTCKCNEIEELECQIAKLKEKLSEKSDGYDHLLKTNDLLKQENVSLRTNWKKYISTRTSSVLDQFQTAQSSIQIDGHFTSPTSLDNVQDSRQPESVDNGSDFSMSYNSPEFQNQIAHPISPYTDSPLTDACQTRRKSGLSDEYSPIPCPKNKDNLLKNVLLKHTSTPDGKSTEGRTLLDSSLPNDSKRLPVMEFTNDSKKLSVIEFTGQQSPPDKASCSSTESRDILEVPTKPVCEILANEVSDDRNFYSFNMSSDEDVFFKMSAASIESSVKPGESLHDELSTATKGVDVDDLLHQLKEHENCFELINSHKIEIADLKTKLIELEDKANQDKQNTVKKMTVLQEELIKKEEEISCMQQTIKSREEDVKQRTEEINNKVAIHNKLWQEIRELKTKVDLQDTKISEYSRLEKKLQVLEENYSTIKKKCTNFENANLELHSANTKLEHINKDQKEQLNKLSQLITAYENDIKTFKGRENKLTKEMNSADNSLSKAQEENCALINDVRELQSKIENLNKRITEQQGEKECLKSVLQDQEKLSLDHANHLGLIRSQLSDKNDELNRLQIDHESLKYEMNGLKARVHEGKKEQLHLSEKNKFLKAELSLVSEKSKQYVKQLEEVEKLMTNMISKKELCNLKLGEPQILNQNQEPNISKTIIQIENIIKYFIDESEMSRQTIQSLQTETEELTNKLQMVDATMSELSRVICESKDNYHKLDTGHKSLLTKYEKKQKTLVGNNHKLKIMKKNNSVLQQKCHKIGKENEILNENNIALNKQVENLNEKNVTLNKQIENLYKEISRLTNLLSQENNNLQSMKAEFEYEMRGLENKNQATIEGCKKLVEELKCKLKKQNDDFLKVEGSLQNEKAKKIELEKAIVMLNEEKAILTKHYDNFKHQQELNEQTKVNYTLVKIRKCIMRSKQNLTSSIDLVIRNVRHVFDAEHTAVFNKMYDTEEIEYNFSVGSANIETLIDEEIARLNDHIHATSQLLEYLARMNTKSSRDVEIQTDLIDDVTTVSMNIHQKQLKKFTLHQSKHLTSCPASPDSPSVMEQFNGVSKGSEKETDEWQGILLDQEAMENNLRDILNDDNHSQPAFPNQSDTFLESVGLLEDSPRKTYSKPEMEEKFTALVLTWTLDRSSVKKRYETQNKLHQKIREQMLQLIGQIIIMLRQHQCSTMGGTVLPAIELLESMKECLDKGFTAAEQFGTLRYEVRHTKYWNLVVNYVASLKQEADASQMLLPSTNESLSKACLDNVNGDTPTKAGELRKRKLHSSKQLQVTVNSEHFTCFKEDSSLPSVFSCNSLKRILFHVMLFSFVVLGFMIYVQVHCTRSPFKKPICPLDYVSKLFIKRVHIGMPPM